jgi:hypothetical protein
MGAKVTTLARLEALEGGQVSILKELADVKGAIGHLSGVTETWIGERREALNSGDKLSASLLRECEDKHKAVDTRLAYHSQKIDTHTTQIGLVEDWQKARVVGWSAYKKLWVAAASFIAVSGTVFGMAEAVAHWMGN